MSPVSCEEYLVQQTVGTRTVALQGVSGAEGSPEVWAPSCPESAEQCLELMVTDGLDG